MENFGLDDKNIATLLSRIREVPEEEDEKEKEVLEKAKPKVRFYKSFGTALTRLEPTELGRRWKGPDCELILELSGRHVTLSGSYDRSVNRLALALGAPLGSLAHLATRHNIKYSARFDGYAVTGTVARTTGENGAPPSLLEAGGDGTKILMVLHENIAELSVVENPNGALPKVYSLTRLDNSESPGN